MFDTVLRTLFPSASTEQENDRFNYLERNRDKTSRLVGTTDNTGSNNVMGSLAPAEGSVAAGPTQRVNPLFYSFLFGEEANTEADQELTLYVSERVKKVMAKPKLLLDALPVMPESVSKVIDVLQDADFDINELLSLIEREPGMAGDLIKLANSARYFRGVKPVSDIRVAFTFMGSQGLMDGVLQVFLKQFSVSSPRYFKQYGNHIWQHSFQTALYSQRIAAETCEQGSKGVAYFVGLIRNLGYMVLFQLVTESFKFVRPEAKPCSETLMKLLNQNSLSITLSVAKHWQLPELVQAALAQQGSHLEQTNEIALCVQQADLISQYVCLFQANLIDKETYKKELLSQLALPVTRKIADEILDEK